MFVYYVRSQRTVCDVCNPLVSIQAYVIIISKAVCMCVLVDCAKDFSECSDLSKFHIFTNEHDELYL